MIFQKRYSLWKSRGILKHGIEWMKRYGETLSPERKAHLQKLFNELDNAILAKEKERADDLAREVEKIGNSTFTIPFWRKALNFTIALSLALVLATIVRQSWWELYQIPTGSMRPTFKEKEALMVSKTTNGLNIPLVTDHFIFDEESVVRGNPIIWSGDGINLPDVDTHFLGIFPYKKRFIKRMIGKPGDTLYFYGGQIWGLDANGNDLPQIRFADLEHVPFRDFEGIQVQSSPQSGFSKQMLFQLFGKTIGKVSETRSGASKTEVVTAKGFQEESPSHPYFKKYGIENFAKARLLTPEQAILFYPEIAKKNPDTQLFLQLDHHPTLKGTKIDKHQSRIHRETTLIPLDQSDLNEIMKGMYTSRFVVENGRAKSYGESSSPVTTMNPTFQNLPSGTYEFARGTAYSIGIQGLETKLPQDHPIYSTDPENVQKLFNFGINFVEYYRPRGPNQSLPARYAYFRDGDLYVLGSPLWKKGNPKLEILSQEEKKRAKSSNQYIPFLDLGRPSKEDILKFGIQVPEKHYLVLGDNHANSADSRYFGFVPEENLEGTPLFIFWPPGERWGIPDQSPTPWNTIPNLIVLVIVGTAFVLWLLYRNHQLNRPQVGD